MKVLFVSIGLVLMSQLVAQNICKRVVEDFGTSSGDYLVEGSATLVDSNGILHLMLSSDFSTNAGPDLHLYLAENDEAPTEATTSGNVSTGNVHVEVHLLNSNSGSQSFEVPGEYALSDFDYVLIHCKEYAHFWDGGALGDEVCEDVNGLENSLTERVAVFPNPTSDFLNIEVENVNNVRVIGADGVVVLKAKTNYLNVSSLQNGAYIVLVETEEGKVFRQLFSKD